MTATQRLDEPDFERVRARAIFECCKWDPQMEDVSVLAPFALVLRADVHEQLNRWAEALAAETMAAEAELTARTDLHGQLGLPWRIRRVLRQRRSAPRGIARVMRFDFHQTTEGWRISEVNSDVPGGFIEAGGFARIMAGQWASARMAGAPAAAIADALAAQLPTGATIGLVHATAYTDDRQVMIYLSRELERRELRPVLVSPAQLRWSAGGCRIFADFFDGRADALLRFFPGEWLVNLPRSTGWAMFFGGSAAALCNPATALLTQSKRLPVVWDRLSSPLTTWRQLLPETHDPRQVDTADGDKWILKPALGRVGDCIGMSGVTPPVMRARIARWAWWYPRHWIAQRRFEAVALRTPDGPQYPCIGVYTVDGRAAGIYGRIAARPLIDDRARDVAVLAEGIGNGDGTHANRRLPDVQPCSV
jgi:glutathionylspermidine synthase